MRPVTLGKVMNVKVEVAFPALVGLVLIVVLGSGVSLLLLTRDIGMALLAGLSVAGIHFITGMVHQLSHAAAARSTGYPMSAFRFGRWLVLATSIYPEHEPQLSSDLHIRRAIGGPIGSLLFGGVCLGAALVLRGGSPLLAAAALLAGADSLIVFTLGSLVPLGFTDISTILHYRGSKRAR